MSAANPVFVTACFGTNCHAFDIQLLKFPRSNALLLEKVKRLRVSNKSFDNIALNSPV
jgi:hypothetical protein